MIRTRDLVVFLGLLFCVLFGIVFTLLTDAQKQDAISFFTFDTTQPVMDYNAEGDTATINRQDIISRLRNALAQKESVIVPSPSVEESEESVSEEDVVVVTPGVTYCASYDDSVLVVRNWPLSHVTQTIEGGRRTFVEQSEEAPMPALSATSSSSSMSAQVTTKSSSKTLLLLPLYPIASSEHCVPGEVIGVTPTGALIYNSEVSLYRGYGGEYLIGYARDGFPIYGYYEGTVDTCGGYMHPSGYRYSITPDRDYVLGCFKGTPASFIGF